MSSKEAEWLWGWDPTPGIVSIHAEPDGRVLVWRRIAATGVLVCEEERFRPWLLLDRLDDLQHLGSGLGRDDDAAAPIRYRELDGSGALRFLVTADDGRALTSAVLLGASQRTGKRVTFLGELPTRSILCLTAEEQYLVATGRTYFRDLAFDDLQRLQFDLETTGLDARRDRIFMISMRYHSGETEVLEAHGEGNAAEADLIRRLMERVRAADPDVIENHNLHGFDIPFLDRRSRMLGVRFSLGRLEGVGLRQRAARRGIATGDPNDRRRVCSSRPGES